METESSDAHTFDVVVLGSGAAGLTAAFTAAHRGARVVVFEKNDRVGGTSAWSGGHVWIPANPHMTADARPDSIEEGVTYLTNLGRGLVRDDVVRALVESGPEMIRYLEEHGGLEFYSVSGLPDYHPEHPGGRAEGGRTLGTPLVSFDELAEWKDKVEVSPYYSVNLRMDETGIGAAVPKPPSAEELARREEADERGMGASLIAMLLRACLAAGVQIEVGTPGVDLLREVGRVSGVRIERDGRHEVMNARRGVILATGGFEWNAEYRSAFLRGPLRAPASIPTNTGDGLRMALQAGAALQNMPEAWWIPITELPPGVNRMNLDMINNDRTRPGSIMVNRQAKRFVNEAANYNAMGGAFHQEDVAAFGYANIPAWIIHDHDHDYLTAYGSIGRPYDGRTPPWLIEAATLRELAQRLGIPEDELGRTVHRWNENVRAGSDPDFHRGESAHDLWWGDPYRKGTREATLGPISTPPFYAMELQPGAIGTKGGPKVDARARVLDHDDNVIEGLYAVGNASSPTGRGYGGPGGTLGPGMTFGWIAGRDAAARGRRTLS